jgi:hypothetical protein
MPAPRRRRAATSPFRVARPHAVNTVLPRFDRTGRMESVCNTDRTLLVRVYTDSCRKRQDWWRVVKALGLACEYVKGHGEPVEPDHPRPWCGPTTYYRVVGREESLNRLLEYTYVDLGQRRVWLTGLLLEAGYQLSGGREGTNIGDHWKEWHEQRAGTRPYRKPQSKTVPVGFAKPLPPLKERSWEDSEVPEGTTVVTEPTQMPPRGPLPQAPPEPLPGAVRKAKQDHAPEWWR